MAATVRASDVIADDRLDLEGDDWGDNELAPFEYAVVEGTKAIGKGSVEVYTDQVNFACPPDHLLRRADQ